MCYVINEWTLLTVGDYIDPNFYIGNYCYLSLFDFTSPYIKLMNQGKISLKNWGFRHRPNHKLLNNDTYWSLREIWISRLSKMWISRGHKGQNNIIKPGTELLVDLLIFLQCTVLYSGIIFWKKKFWLLIIELMLSIWLATLNRPRLVPFFIKF